jgi:SAM-dependent methyltransferase
MTTHPSFANWLGGNRLGGKGKRALVVGCGLGDDAIELESLGFQVTAFDVSATAIARCKERFPESSVGFEQADLLAPPSKWRNTYDFVLEIYTVQALPPKYEGGLIQSIADFVAPGGTLLAIADVSSRARTFENGPPRLLMPDHIDSYVSCGLSVQTMDIEKRSRGNDGGIYVTAFERPST